MTKLFKATWGEGYAYPDSAEITMEDITEENGWFEENIQAIDDLQVGGVVDCSCFTAELFVERIK